MPSSRLIARQGEQLQQARWAGRCRRMGGQVPPPNFPRPGLLGLEFSRAGPHEGLPPGRLRRPRRPPRPRPTRPRRGAAAGAPRRAPSRGAPPPVETAPAPPPPCEAAALGSQGRSSEGNTARPARWLLSGVGREPNGRGVAVWRVQRRACRAQCALSLSLSLSPSLSPLKKKGGGGTGASW